MSETSLEAYMQLPLNRLQKTVYELIVNTPNGLTQAEAKQILGWKHETLSPRFWELERMGRIKRTRKAWNGKRHICIYRS